jgi:hypothetical protein
MNAITGSMTGITVRETLAQDSAVNHSKTAADRMSKCVKSNPAQPKDYTTKQRDKWLNKLANELRIISFRQFPVADCSPRENCPEWVSRVQQEYFRATYPQLYLENTKKVIPVELAGFLGYQCAYAVSIMECVEAGIKDATENSEKHKNVNMTEREIERGLNYLRRLYEWYGALRRLAGRALKSCVYQQYEDMSEFLSAYSRAFSRKPKTTSGIGDFGNTAFGIYHFMLFHWRAIERLESVRELHEMLRKHLGEYRVGGLKRVEKICQRIGCHFRKAGRPKASK